MASHPHAFFKQLLNGDGFLHEERIFSRRTPIRLSHVADWLYNTFDTPSPDADTDSVPEKYLRGTNQAWGGLQMDSVSVFTREKSAEMHDAFSRAVKDVVESINPLLGKGWVWNESASFFRRLTRAGSSVGWHSDAEAASTLGAGQQAVTVWVPLVDVGESLPSLEFVCGSQRKMRQPPTQMPSNRVRSVEWVDEEFDGARVVPKAKPRDALMFDEFTLHRTQLLSRPSGVRTSCEFRFIRPGAPRQPSEISINPEIPKSSLLEVVRGTIGGKTRRVW